MQIFISIINTKYTEKFSLKKTSKSEIIQIWSLKITKNWFNIIWTSLWLIYSVIYNTFSYIKNAGNKPVSSANHQIVGPSW